MAHIVDNPMEQYFNEDEIHLVLKIMYCMCKVIKHCSLIILVLYLAATHVLVLKAVFSAEIEHKICSPKSSE